MSSPATPAQTLSLPPTVLYPEREVRPEGWLDRVATRAAEVPAVRAPGLFSGRLSHIVGKVERRGAGLGSMGDEALIGLAGELRDALRARGFTTDLVARTFALVREVTTRHLGQRHYDVQLIGGLALLRGTVAEMGTGEGKTLAATLPACVAALAGVPVHVVTVNDYLVRRDADLMGPVYRALGLRVGAVVHGMSTEQRRAAYRCDITYCSNKEVAFDYLRDHLVLGQAPANLRLKLERLYGRDARADRLVMRGLHFAIVDEADSVLIDEARTPLIISSQTESAGEQRWAEEAMSLVAPLERDVDFLVLADQGRVDLTDRGSVTLAEAAARLGGLWTSRIRREETARQALAALHLFRRDDHYLVRDSKVQIVDEYTGRVMADRSWSEGLHQLIEAKEGCPVTGRKVPLARMTYQRFFRKYRHLSGMTGTAREAAGELWAVYRLPVVRIPTHKPVRRRHGQDRVCRSADEKWSRIARRVGALRGKGCPVLVGTRSVAASERASEYLAAAGIEHVVLSAAQDQEEAEIIARAGETGRVTIATNMAGRGVDIKLAAGVAALGGLHVIMSERHDAGRIDRQLLGRCGRQGEPGMTETIVSLEDPLLELHGERFLRSLAKLPGPLGRWLGRVLFDRTQRRAERTHSRMRRELIRYDSRLNTLLAFAGRAE
ncbi:MAG: preprotein translocase subunit SecA [Planctomycetota bacterium]|nr:preprotein translocase subunit SecA [Planctomycetota bacterium]